MRDYESRAVDRIFERCKVQLHYNVNKLINTTGYYTCIRPEVWQEMCMLFFQNFEEYYEADRQYLSFLFICCKNRIRNMQKLQYKREDRFCTDLSRIRNGLNIGFIPNEQICPDEYSATWGQVADASCSFSDMELQEIIDNAKCLMDKMGKDVFDDLMYDSVAVVQVSEAIQLRKIKYPTPQELRKLRRLENKSVGCNTISEVINVIETSIRPVFDRRELSTVSI